MQDMPLIETNIHRRSRATVAEREALAQDSEEAQKRKEAEVEERKKASHDLVAESIRRELLESAYISLFISQPFGDGTHFPTQRRRKKRCQISTTRTA